MSLQSFRWRALGVAGPLGLATSLYAAQGASAPAPQPGAALEVRRGEGAGDCPGTEALAELVTQQLGRPAFLTGPEAKAAARTTFQVWFSAEGGVRRARVSVEGAGAGERELADEGGGCDDLAEALATTMAIALSQGATEAPRPPPPAPAPPPPPPEARLGVSLEASAELSSNLLRTFSPGVSALAELRPRPWLGLGLGALLLPTTSVERGPGAIDVSIVAADARACGALPSERMRLALCASVYVGALRGAGEGFAPNERATGRWVALAAGPRFQGAIYGELHWTAHASAVVPLLTDHFTVEGLDGGFDPPSFGAMVGGGLAWSIR
ncbi:MAG: hypothetical protein MUF34_33635 [Polyangiaceae bacterium]|nr:hypothetical protein [Polyangiaceae bacterium]